MENELNNLYVNFDKDFEGINTLKDLENLRVKYIGKKGLLSSYYEKFGKLSKEERPKIGQILNSVKTKIETKLSEKIEVLSGAVTSEKIDFTMPGYKLPAGKYHLITQTIDRVKEIFHGLNFEIVDGPEIETDYYNFEALNFPKHHPARDMQDTFHVDGNHVLRTHTSPVQVRTMEKRPPPLNIISIGKCYRNDPLDASHLPVFQQVEGLMVNEDINFGDLKGVLKIFFSEYFQKETNIRLNPSFFPFTEPSAEVSVTCPICKNGCPLCKKSGWIEIFGAGMVDPNVFKNVNYDTEKWTGFAFGGGIERLTLIKHSINDIRLLYENDVRFLNQF
ncbi:MAG: phenylalanine--tRNA ligase subunit alpha [Candidatus Firestonebacteria bacterium RIFOXYC2_FULL_39_67]|nr:MAG: phenylalanine--tRNA ligase subunit alpha [Candidatus Firestonebacteria bacterium RIFOXYD2_FULL_39_29]OGF54121.1 MAG: phenylalanine--tRNA ligase subunit alpha [Candidatus Firestonebacteria bacterium RIFOXYC2_FULL_39_67]OGF55357.1 MAG: phenylalanine--tRNA ligase subunit alpha [Candidatus Firestonebacteria bacterium RifOxyC12_full_39_7]